MFNTAWEARAAAAMLAWYVDTGGRRQNVWVDDDESVCSSSSGSAAASAAAETAPAVVLAPPVSESALDDVLRVLGVTEESGGDPFSSLPVRAMLSLRREATSKEAGRGLQLDASLRRNLLILE